MQRKNQNILGLSLILKPSNLPTCQTEAIYKLRDEFDYHYMLNTRIFWRIALKSPALAEGC